MKQFIIPENGIALEFFIHSYEYISFEQAVFIFRENSSLLCVYIFYLLFIFL